MTDRREVSHATPRKGSALGRLHRRRASAHRLRAGTRDRCPRACRTHGGVGRFASLRVGGRRRGDCEHQRANAVRTGVLVRPHVRAVLRLREPRPAVHRLVGVRVQPRRAREPVRGRRRRHDPVPGSAAERGALLRPFRSGARLGDTEEPAFPWRPRHTPAHHRAPVRRTRGAHRLPALRSTVAVGYAFQR